MIDIKQVVSVYSGKAGKCACGCAGKHSYASRHRGDASKRRGYAVDVNDRMVSRVVNLLNSTDRTKCEDNLAWVDIGNRTYIAYFQEGTQS